MLNRGSMFAFHQREFFLGVKLRPQTPPIDKREIGDTTIPFPGNAEYILLFQQTRVINQ